MIRSQHWRGCPLPRRAGSLGGTVASLLLVAVGLAAGSAHKDAGQVLVAGDGDGQRRVGA